MKNFTLRISLLISFILFAGAVFGQQVYQTVGIIGSATTNGWDASTPMTLANAGDPHQWTLTLQLASGEAKFRANNNWDVNWGATAFPSGNGAQNGPNIPIPNAGYYTVTFNDVTGAYFFQALTQEVYASIGVVGSATPGSWDNSTPMEQDPADPHQWSVQLNLTPGEAKFRANNSWDVNWGGSVYPGGTAVRNGANIPIPAAGQYTITFNDVTGQYYFNNLNQTVYATIGVIGTSTSHGWDASTAMSQTSGSIHDWTLTTYLTQGEIKFRANDSWDANWGGTAFPSGTATANGPNIQVNEAAYYTVQFNDISGAYNFLKLNPTTYGTVGIIGTATANGWDASTPMDVGPDGHTWTLTNFTLFTGEAKFRANNTWDVNWGGSDFPNGIGTSNGPNISIPGGVYNISFNDVTQEYSFVDVGVPQGPIVTLDPWLPTIDEPVTITYDANQGVSGLRNADKVYLHSGVIFSGYSGTSWNNVVGNWGQDDGVGEMTRIPGTNKWQITLPSIRQYYNIGSGGPVFRLGMVFRNANGSQTGKSNTDGDIFVNVNPGDYARFRTPTSNQIFGVAGEQIQITGETSDVASPFTIQINEGSGYHEVASEYDVTTISYNYTIGTATTVRVRLISNLSENTIVVEKVLSIVIREPNTTADLPAGLKNGINYDPTDPTKATLVLLAPQKRFVYAVGDFNNWQISSDYQMNVTPDGETFWLELTNLEPQREYVFQYWVDGTVKIGDPYADKVADPFNDNAISSDVYPNPVYYDRIQDGIATVLQTGQTPYQWVSQGIAGGRPAKENLVVYELLVRDFLGSHSYQDLADTLSYLKRLGVNAIELLPIMEFEGNESWGYNPSYLFAPDKYYGTKNDLKAFIDKAHQEGFAVILDMVLNHQFGQSPMVRMYWDQALGKPSLESPWFNQDATHPFNVGFDFNHESPYTKRYVDDVNRYWLQEYRFDGFRFDLSKGFTQTNNPNDVGAWSAYDQSRVDILTRMTDEIRVVDPNAYVIMEHLAVNEEEKVLADYGIMLWGNMNHSYSDVVNGDITEDLNWTLSSTRGWNQKNVVPYMESHDEERLMVRALNSGATSGDYNIKDLGTALERVKMASAFFYPLPGPKMLWQFGELGYDVSIDYNGRTGNKPIPWGDLDGLNYYGNTDRMKLYKVTSAIINLVDDYNQVFEQGNFTWTPSGQFRRINVSHADMNVTIVGNFGVTAGTINPEFQHTGTWYDFFAGGRAINVSSTTASVSLDPGEFHIYVDRQIHFPENGLVKTRMQILAPSNLQASHSNNVISLSWNDNSTGETGFAIERRADNGAFVQFATVGENVTSYSDNAITDGVTYEYRVKTTAGSDSDWSNTVSVNLPLLAPTALAIQSQTIQSVTITWTDNSSHETSFAIERADGSQPFELLVETQANIVSFTDATIQKRHDYRYRVYAKDDDEQSALSNEVTAPAIIEILAPANLQATYTGGAISLSWDDGSYAETGFVIERREDTGSFTQTASLSEDVTSYTDNNIADGVTYEYRVKTISDVRPHSDWSNTASVNLPLFAPSNLVVTSQTKQSVGLAWSDNSGHENAFVIERAEGGLFATLTEVPANTTSFTDLTAQNRDYQYRVYAKDDDEQSGRSNEVAVQAIVDIFIPGNLQANYSGGSISLTWLDTSAGESGFEIERRGDQGTFAFLVTVAPNATSYNDVNFNDGITYEYRIRTLSGSGSPSDWSNSASVNLPLFAPTNLAVTSSSKHAIAIAWTDNSSHESAYVIERAENKGKKNSPFATLAEVAANTTSFVDQTVQNNREYVYRVYAKDSDERSTYSNEVTAESDWRGGWKRNLDVYPNPASVELTIHHDKTSKGKFKIVNLHGKVVTEFELSKNKTEIKLDVSSWKEGIYLLLGQYQDGSFETEFIWIRR